MKLPKPREDGQEVRRGDQTLWVLPMEYPFTVDESAWQMVGESGDFLVEDAAGRVYVLRAEDYPSFQAKVQAAPAGAAAPAEAVNDLIEAR